MNKNIKESYYLSRYFECWGWATWKDRWELCDLEFKEYFNLKEQGRLNNYFFNWVEKYIYSKRFEDNLNKKTNSWAYPFTWTHFFHRRIAITPKKNLVKNIGFERNSTHTKEGRVDEKYFNKNSEKIEFPLIHPEINLNRNLVKKYLYKELRRIILKKTLGKLI